MFERFSGGYYLGRLFVEPHGRPRALMQRDQHERINEQLHATDEGVERLDAPLVMKIGPRHFPVHSDRAVPTGTLALPPSLLEDCRLDNPPERRAILLATADRATQLLRVAGARPAADRYA